MNKSGFTALEVAIVLVILTLTTVLLVPSYRKKHEKANRTKCSSNLRNLGLSALQYSDDLRFLPHVGRLNTLDGGFDDSGPTTTAANARALLWYQYTDNPEGWICSSSVDSFRPIESATTKGNLRLWFWGGQHAEGDPELPPFVDGLPDPAMSDTDELSYGWTRKGLNRNCRSTTYLAADRAVRIESEQDAVKAPGERGNHDDGWNVLFADAAVLWFASNEDLGQPGSDTPLQPADVLSATSHTNDGFLAIRDQRAALGTVGS